MIGRTNTKFLAIILICLITAVFTVGCNKSKYSVKHPKVQIEMEDGGKMILELYPEYAPETVDNFITLAEEGFYDGLTFHRIIQCSFNLVCFNTQRNFVCYNISGLRHIDKKLFRGACK